MSSLLDAVEQRVDGGQLAVLRALRRRAAEQPLSVHLVGGPVRDLLLGRPMGDLDFVVEGDAPSLARELAEELGGGVVVHHAFGTATISLGDDRVDMVTARSESYPRPGALPEVVPGTLAEDLARRDFTINSMALPLTGDRGGVVDPHGGEADLNAGLVRVLHAGSFSDDPTRIFRAARYEQRLGFRLEWNTRELIDEALAAGGVRLLSPDRVRHELERIFDEAEPGPVLKRLAGLGVLAQLSPGWGGIETIDGVGRVAEARQRSQAVTPMMWLASMVFGMEPRQMEALVGRLNMPNSWAKVSRDTVAINRLEKGDLSSPELSNSRLAAILGGLSEDSVRAAAMITGPSLVAERLDAYLSVLRFVTPLLDGNEILALGTPSGPMVGRILDELNDAKLDGRVDTMEDERRFVREALVRGGDSEVG